MAEKRVGKRHRKRLTLKFGIDNPSRIAFTEDISADGFFIKSTNICPPNTVIIIDLTLPDESVVTLEAKVMWAKKVPPAMIHLVRKSGMGVRIVRIISGAETFAQLCTALAG